MPTCIEVVKLKISVVMSVKVERLCLAHVYGELRADSKY